MIFLQAVQDFQFGMAIRISVGDGDHGIGGRHRGQEAGVVDVLLP